LCPRISTAREVREWRRRTQKALPRRAEGGGLDPLNGLINHQVDLCEEQIVLRV
jgi:hypothetical protein